MSRTPPPRIPPDPRHKPARAAAVLAAGRDLAGRHFPVGDDDAGRLQSHPGGDRPGRRGDGLRHADRVRAGDPVGAADRSDARVGEPAGAGGCHLLRGDHPGRADAGAPVLHRLRRRAAAGCGDQLDRQGPGGDGIPGRAGDIVGRDAGARSQLHGARHHSARRSATAHSSRRSSAPASSRSAAARWRPPARWG